MVLACSHIDKSFNDQVIFSDATFHINDGERAALVGSNGTGKTTLLRIIVGELAADGGEITTAKDKTIGYLPQQQGYHSENSIYEELLEVKKRHRGTRPQHPRPGAADAAGVWGRTGSAARKIPPSADRI